MGSIQRLISIDALEGDLAYAERELAKATEATARANEAELQWQTEVTGLRNLIRIRKQRMSPGVANSVAAVSDDQTSLASEVTALPVGPPKDDEDVNKVDWIDGLIAASGTAGIAPPEIMKTAEKQLIKMHPNYPYVVLRKLVEKGRAVKRRGRYYKKEI
jgi:hypothetical protein